MRSPSAVSDPGLHCGSTSQDKDTGIELSVIVLINGHVVRNLVFEARDKVISILSAQLQRLAIVLKHGRRKSSYMYTAT